MNECKLQESGLGVKKYLFWWKMVEAGSFHKIFGRGFFFFFRGRFLVPVGDEVRWVGLGKIVRWGQKYPFPTAKLEQIMVF